MTATAATTIQKVSILTRRRRNDDLFDITLSADGIDIQRPGQPVQHLSWERVSEWEIEERKNNVVLTLRGNGASTPLVVPGWSVEDLEVLMRELTAGSTAYVAEVQADAPLHQTYEPVVPVTAEAADDAPSRAAARAARRGRGRRTPWRPLVTVVLLGLLATAVTLVLLQSAGVITWSFLGPTS